MTWQEIIEETRKIIGEYTTENYTAQELQYHLNFAQNLIALFLPKRLQQKIYKKFSISLPAQNTDIEYDYPSDFQYPVSPFYFNGTYRQITKAYMIPLKHLYPAYFFGKSAPYFTMYEKVYIYHPDERNEMLYFALPTQYAVGNESAEPDLPEEVHFLIAEIAASLALQRLGATDTQLGIDLFKKALDYLLALRGK